MNGTLALLLPLGTLASPGDTLVEVRRGDRLILRDFGGSVYVESWERPFLRAEVGAKESASFRVQRSGSSLELRLADGEARNREEELRLVLPPWLNLEITGRALEVEVRDLKGELMVRNFRGDLSFRNLAGKVEAYTVEGGIEAYNLTGSARLRTGDDDLFVGSSSAALELETVEGEIRMEGIDSHRVSAKTTEGEIEFSGRLLAGGEYGFFSHGGEIQLRLAPPVNLEATILAYEGDFESDFPVKAKGYRSGEGLEFTLGTGGARLVIETFDGEIRLLRVPGVGDRNDDR
ncbi:MAG: DUF4097 family beta strand repeat-containing protein [Gemmatimonadota bacterium]